jgi:hypothetical protein
MWTRSRVTLAMVMLLTGPAVVGAVAAETLVGAVTTVSDVALQVKTNDGAVRAVTLDSKTAYVRWITHKPWQQSSVADHSLVKPGRCVAVDLRNGNEHVAKLVQISTDEIGTIYCPCRSAR